MAAWDREELIRGQQRARDGTFRGRPSKLVPRPIYDELRRRTMDEVYEEVRKAALPAAETLRRMATGEEPADPVRLKAVQEVLDRFIGKAPQHVSVEATVKPYEQVLRGGVVRDLPPEDEIVDAEVVDERDDDWWNEP